MEINFNAELVYTAADLSRFNNCKPTHKLNGKNSDLVNTAKSEDWDDVLFIPSEELQGTTLGVADLRIEKNRFQAPESYKTQGAIIFDHDFLYKSTDFLLARANQLAQGMDAQSEQFDQESYIFASTALSFFSGNINVALSKMDHKLNPDDVMNLIHQLENAAQELASQIKSTGKADINALKSTLTIAGFEVNFSELAKIKDQFKTTFDAYTQGNVTGEVKSAKLGLAYSSIKSFARANFDAGLRDRLVGIMESHINKQLDCYKMIGANDESEKILRDYMDAQWEVIVKRGGSLPSKTSGDPSLLGLKDDPYYTASGKFFGTVRETVFKLFASLSGDQDDFDLGFSKAMDEFTRLHQEAYIKQGWTPSKLPQSSRKASNELVEMYEKLGHGKHIDTTV